MLLNDFLKLLQTNRSTKGAPNSYAYNAVEHIDNDVFDMMELNFSEILHFGRYHDDFYCYGVVD